MREGDREREGGEGEVGKGREGGREVRERGSGQRCGHSSNHFDIPLS